jgi:hypothetical protein
MAKSRQVTGLAGGLAIASSQSQFHVVGDGPILNSASSTTETNVQVDYRTAGVFSNLYLRVTANNYATTLAPALRQNAATSALVLSVGIAATGVFEDTTHTVTIVAGDKLAYLMPTNSAAKSITLTMFASTFDATSTTCTRCLAAIFGVSTGSQNTNRYQPVGGKLLYTNTTEANAKTRMQVAGTFANMSIRLSANTITGSITSRKNGANGNMTVSITATTGWFEDTTHTDTVAANDDYNTTYVMASTTSTTIQHIGLDFTDATGAFSIHCNADPTLSVVNQALTVFYPMAGELNSTATEANTKVLAKDIYACSKLTTNLTANTVTATSTLRFRKTGANGNQAVSITASTTGIFTDSTHTDTTAATDDMNYQLVTGTGGTSMTLSFIDMFATTASGIAVNKSLTETVSISESLAMLRGKTRTRTETVAITESISRLAAKNRLAGSLNTYV